MESKELIYSIEENLKVGLIDILLLHQLTKEDMYGYQIRDEIAKITDNKIFIKDGSLYGPLHRMENKNFITSYKVLVGARRSRVYYHIEEAGLHFLHNAYIAINNVFTGTNKCLL